MVEVLLAVLTSTESKKFIPVLVVSLLYSVDYRSVLIFCRYGLIDGVVITRYAVTYYKKNGDHT